MLVPILAGTVLGGVFVLFARRLQSVGQRLVIALHLDRAQPLVGAWYPLSCIGFDLIVAGFLLSGASYRMSR